jgi:adenylyltransferase/sulfurtransferase
MREIEPNALAERLARGEPTYLLDVREPWEYRLASIAGSVLLPLGELQQRLHDVRPPDGALLVTICHHGVRSLQAAMWLQSTGFPATVSLGGGIDAWSALVDPSVPRY